MNAAIIQRFLSQRYVWAVFAGILLAASFPKPSLAGLAWVAPGFLLFAALGVSGRQALRIGYIGGMAHYLTSLYWLLFIPFPAGAVAGWLALSAYLALYPALWVWFCWRIFPGPLFEGSSDSPAFGVPALAGFPAPNHWTDELRTHPESARSKNADRWPFERFLLTPLPLRILWTIACAVLWVALEMVVARLFTGFPWNLLGASQYRILPLIQIASVTGVYGVSFLVVWFSVSLVCAFLAIGARPTASKAWLGDLLLPLLSVAAVAGFGGSEISKPANSNRSLEAVLVQPSIPQTLIWDAKEDANRFGQLLRLSERALETKPDLLIWPEASVPSMLRYEPDLFNAVAKLVITNAVWMIVGADDAMPQDDSPAGREFNYFNSSFLITPEAELRATYRKRRLVIFGEYVPLVRWLPFMKHLTPIGAGFTPGEQPMPFRIPELGAKTSVLICFEDVFPHFAREYVEPDTDFLLNLTNNGWFGESAAQWQHAANAVFRAVENRVPLVRCANNGLSCWVDPLGGLHEVYFENTRDIYGAGFKSVRIPLLPEGEVREPTIYNRHGDWFGWGCVGLSGLLLLSSVRTGVRSKHVTFGEVR